MWAVLIPQDIEDERSVSIFEKNYQMLKQGGLEFPAEKDYIVYSDRNVEKKYGL